jgi:hypothetical protein
MASQRRVPEADATRNEDPTVIQDTVAPPATEPSPLRAWLVPASTTGEAIAPTNGRRLAAASIGASLYPFAAVAFTPLVGTAGAVSGVLGLAVGILIAGLIVPARTANEWARTGALTFALGLALGVIHLLMMLGVVAAV